jgi:hypothetical protein
MGGVTYVRAVQLAAVHVEVQEAHGALYALVNAAACAHGG